MFKKIIYFSLAIVMLSACSTFEKSVNKSVKKSIKTVEKTVPPPAGIEFTKVKNYKSFALINLPYSGKGFSKNEDVDIDSNVNDADEFVPGVRYERNPFLKWSTIRGAEGDLDAQYVALKKAFLGNQISDNSEIVFEKQTIGKYQTARVIIITPIRSGAITYAYGYLIAYGNKAAAFMVEDVMMQGSEVDAFTQPLDEAMRYMIETVEFK